MNEMNTNNSKSPPRSDSPTSTSTATSAGTVTPPLQGNYKNNNIFSFRTTEYSYAAL